MGTLTLGALPPPGGGGGEQKPPPLFSSPQPGGGGGHGLHPRFVVTKTWADTC